jgi:hypothetical protein
MCQQQSEDAGHPTPAAVDRRRLSIGADQSCGGAPWRELGRGAPKSPSCAGGISSGSSGPRGISAHDEIQRDKGQRFWTVLSDIVHGEVIGLRPDRSQASARALLRDELTPAQGGRIHADSTDMHQPYLNAVAAALPKADVVFDKFHVLQHASAALDDVRRQEFFRAGAVMRPNKAHGKYLLSGGVLMCPTCGGHFEGRKNPWRDGRDTCPYLRHATAEVRLLHRHPRPSYRGRG